MLRLGRISYVNMAPVFYRLEAEVEEATGALESAREVALEYAQRARACLNGVHRPELETLTHLVVHRES